MLFEKEKSYFWMALTEKHVLISDPVNGFPPVSFTLGNDLPGVKVCRCLFVNTPNLLILYVVFVLLTQYFYTNSRMLEQTELLDQV